METDKNYTEKGGYIYISEPLTTLGLTAEEWEVRLESKGHKLSDWARDILSKPDYNEKHRYEPGQKLKVVLIRGKEIKENSERLTKNLKAIAVKNFSETSVSGLKGELALLIREKFSNKELEEMDLWYIAILHEPIIDSVGDPLVFDSRRDDGESWVAARFGGRSDRWSGKGAFAFLQD